MGIGIKLAYVLFPFLPGKLKPDVLRDCTVPQLAPLLCGFNNLSL